MVIMGRNSVAGAINGCALFLFSAHTCAQFNQEVTKQETPKGQPTTPTLEDIARIRSMADLEFKKAIFWKPQNTIGTGLGDMAILLVEQVEPPALRPPIGQFGAVVENANGKIEVQESEPTIYFGWAQTKIGGDTYRQITFLWFYPNRAPDSRWPIAWRMVRLTLDKSGALFTAEAIDDLDKWDRFFVSASLEDLTQQLYRVPKPGRKFCLERPVEEAPKAMVVRVMEEGPIPTGPYVYLTWPDREISTLLCRCSPSQAEEFVEDRTYVLRPLQALPSSLKLLWEGLLTGKGMGGSTVPDLRLPTALMDLIKQTQQQFQGGAVPDPGSPP